ncbi:hypothetical protein L1987_30895 [Smallanthus sonchifolius]|uniref:Uncharacterized protein n=1 Tax=Smallanthus sonchifolius TaxID=185202 RepID=A0ACB9I6R9_9ASTR|nr:hypothetical protein L1987_30895 [Smallanthus sonchifolius]
MKMLFLHIACFFVGKDRDYVEKILGPDYSAVSGIKTLIYRCLLSVSPNKKLTMHRLLQEMGKHIVRQESDIPAERSRVWLSSDSHKILSKNQGSKTVQGLALDMKMLSKEDTARKSSNLCTDALNKMDRLKFLQLNFVELNGSYENISEDLRWLCWLGFHLRTIPPDLYMRNLVAIDMSYSKLEVFEPPTVLQSLRILNLKDSHSLTEICNISKIPHLETLILWNCHSLKLAYPGDECAWILAGDTIDYIEIRGWRKTGRPKQVNPSLTEVKTIRCIIHGPQLEDIYKMAEMSKSSIGDKTAVFTSSLLHGETKSGTRSELIDETMEKQKKGEGMSKAFASDEIKESDSLPLSVGQEIKFMESTDIGQIPLQKAQQIVLRWDSTVSEDARARMIFQSDRQEIDHYLQAVDEIQRSMESTTVSDDNEQSKKVNTMMQIAMARLANEFRHILISHTTPIDTESLTESISSTQLTSKGSSLFSEFHDTDDHISRGEDVSVHTIGSSSEQGESSSTTVTYRSMSRIREIDLIPSDSIYNLRCIAERMITAGYFSECVQVYGSVRKSAVDASFNKLGVEKLSIGDIQRLEWEAFNANIGKWNLAAKVCVRVLFASEKRLCRLIFEDLGTDADDACFLETVKAPVIQLFNFAEAISISRRSPEKLFKILDLHNALLDLLPDIDAVFDSISSESIRVQVTEILSRLAEAAREMLSEFENVVLREPSKVPVPLRNTPSINKVCHELHKLDFRLQTNPRRIDCLQTFNRL